MLCRYVYQRKDDLQVVETQWTLLFHVEWFGMSCVLGWAYFYVSRQFVYY